MVASKATEYFNSVLSLVLLPGGFPMCYAMGDCLVTDYEVWKEFKEACQKKAETFAKIEVYGEEPPPFSWGLRPISPEKLHHVEDYNTKIWVWTFVLSNIAPYRAARNIFLNSLQAEPAALVKELMETYTRVPEEDILDGLMSTLNMEHALTPGELAETYRVQNPDRPQYVNLALMQLSEQRIEMARINHERQSRRLDFISSSSSEAEDPPATVTTVTAGPAPGPAAVTTVTGTEAAGTETTEQTGQTGQIRSTRTVNWV
jgi:hypothetical protein